MSIRPLLLTLVIAVVLPGVVAGCGRDEPSRDDRETVRALLRSSAAVERAVSPLHFCLPEQRRCYRDAGPTVVSVVERERAAFDDALSETDNECLADAGGAYADALDAYSRAGEAAVRGRPAAVDRAIARSTEAQIAFLERIGECGFSQGRYAEVGAMMRRVGIDILRLSTEGDACPDEACVRDVARRMEGKAQEGLRALDEFLAEARAGDAPACLVGSLENMRTAYQALERASSAVQERRYRIAEREGERATRFGAQAQDDLAACLGTMNE
jgi:hypothetical protein